MPELVQLNARKLAVRVGMIAVLLLTVVWTLFVVCWYVANTLAENVNPDPNNLNVLQSAETLSPNDPMVHWSIAQTNKQQFSLDSLNEAIREYKTAVRLSPNDYRLWISLGTALEQSGDKGRAEQALRKAVALAPSYSYPHWYLGNALLRSNKLDEAFTELRVAGDSNSELQTQLYNLAWEIYGNDPVALQHAIGTSPTARAGFSLYLIGRGRVDDGVKLWKALDEKDRRLSRETANQILANLLQAGRFHDAMDVWNGLAPNEGYQAKLGTVLDGGFEQNISHSPDTAFGWQVGSVPQLQIGIDASLGHASARSLRFTFHVRTALDAIKASQLVPVQKETSYEFECFVKTVNLETAVTPFVEIVDAADGSGLAASSPVSSGNTDWQQVAFSFKTRANTEAVTIRISRSKCDDNVPVCPIFGSVWYDDFSLKRRN